MRFGGTVELHLHMDICMSFEAVASLDPSVDADAYRRDFVGPERFDSLVSFLASTGRHIDLLQTERGLRTCMRDLRAQLAADDALHAEPRFAPLQHLEGDLTAREAVEIVVEEARDWQRDGLSCAVILCTLRHYSEAESIQTAEVATALHSEDLPVAFDLAGDEAGYPLATHLRAFEIVRGAGAPFTVHAGEAVGAESVAEVLDCLQPRRISHGVRSIEDPAVVARLVREGVHLEACPSSNVQTSAAPSIAEHPIDALAAAGVSIGISTDQRGITDTTLTNEMRLLVDVFGWDRAVLARRQLDALEAAFVTEPKRARLRERLVASWA
ncbi:MAG: adenosine deaminase family protein [bacterium]|nr:adenosine deaminase family protein [bacterium]